MPPRKTASQYREDLLTYHDRSYTKTIFQGYIYRFLKELFLRDETRFTSEFPDLDTYPLASLSTFTSSPNPTHTSTQYTYSQLHSLTAHPLPPKNTGQVLFLTGHMPGSWVAGIGARFNIAYEFFRRHIHIWRSAQGAVMYAVSNLPSADEASGLGLRVNTGVFFTGPLKHARMASRRNILPERAFHNPMTLEVPPGSAYLRGHVPIDEEHFYLEQDVSIVVRGSEEGEGWTAIVWSDIGSRSLSHSTPFHTILTHLTSHISSSLRSVRLLPISILGFDAELLHPLPPTSPSFSPGPPSLVQAASHLPHEFHLVLDPSLAALDPLYALSPIFRFVAISTKTLLSSISHNYELISSTKWDPQDSHQNLEQLLLQKHTLDTYAAKHEQVLRFWTDERLNSWGNPKTDELLDPQKKKTINEAKSKVKTDYQYLLSRTRELSAHHSAAISTLTSAAALRESREQILLAKQVRRLTVLATVFLPLSYCASVFGMNFVELEGLRLWIWGVVTLVVGVLAAVVYE